RDERDDRRMLAQIKTRTVIADREPAVRPRRAAEHLIGGEARDALGARVAGGNRKVRELENDAIGERIDHRAEALLAFAERAFDTTALGDVDEAEDHVAHFARGRVYFRDGVAEDPELATALS